MTTATPACAPGPTPCRTSLSGDQSHRERAEVIPARSRPGRSEISIMKFNFEIKFSTLKFHIVASAGTRPDRLQAAPPKRAWIAMTTTTPACAPGPTLDGRGFSGNPTDRERAEVIPARSRPGRSNISIMKF